MPRYSPPAAAPRFHRRGAAQAGRPAWWRVSALITSSPAGKCAAVEAPVVGDLHGSAAYKRVLVEVHLRRALQKALDS